MFKLKAIGVSEGLAHAKALVIRRRSDCCQRYITDVAAEQQRVPTRSKRQKTD